MLTAVVVFFFFQAEDGIRDLTVTGVQTCALPISLEWRPYVRDGILEWNGAFEAAGIRNAIQVLDAPDDTLWSAEDARYSTVRWMANNAFTYAIGPSDVDPRTGEILNADILVEIGR